MILSQSAHGQNCTVDETSPASHMLHSNWFKWMLCLHQHAKLLGAFHVNTNCEIQWHRPLAVTSHLHSKDEQFKWNKYNDIKYSIAAEKILFVKWPFSGSRFIIIFRRLKWLWKKPSSVRFLVLVKIKGFLNAFSRFVRTISSTICSLESLLMLLNLTADLNRYFIVFKPRENELGDSRREKKIYALSFL